MNTKIRSRTAFPRVLEETLYQAYQEGKTLSRFPSFVSSIRTRKETKSSYRLSPIQSF